MHRCKRSRGSTHSVASLHLGFLDAGFCDGKLVFATVSSHDYTEGHMQAPLGAQVFPDRAKAFAERMRAGSRRSASGDEGGESCVRVTYRMLPQVWRPALLVELQDAESCPVLVCPEYFDSISLLTLLALSLETVFLSECDSSIFLLQFILGFPVKDCGPEQRAERVRPRRFTHGISSSAIRARPSKICAHQRPPGRSTRQ